MNSNITNNKKVEMQSYHMTLFNFRLLMGISRQTLNNWIKRGKLEVETVVYFLHDIQAVNLNTLKDIPICYKKTVFNTLNITHHIREYEEYFDKAFKEKKTE